MTAAQLEDVIATTAPILYKTIPQSVIDSKKTYGTEDEVILTYNEILGRNPDPQELVTYSKKLKQDVTFSVDKLRQLLISSIEYMHLSKMQSNMVSYNLLGGVTDRQINMSLEEMYKSITGKDMDADTYGFMKKKYIEFELNEGKMADFIKKYASNAPYCNKDSNITTDEAIKMMQMSLAAQQQKAQTQSGASAASQPVASASTTPNRSASTTGGNAAASGTSATKPTQQVAETSQQTKPAVTQEGAVNANRTMLGAMPPNKEFIENLKNACLTQDSDYVVDTQSVFDTINKNASCVFDKNVTPSKQETMLSNTINERNKEEMKSLCQRNSVFGNSDSDYVLRNDQAWSVPQPRPSVCLPSSKCEVASSTDQTALIGTLLNDSNKSSVGSILPIIPPRW
jgi:hypothetical protein